MVETLELFNTKFFLSKLCGDALVGLGAFGFLEFSMPSQMEQILKGLKRAGLPAADLVFWRHHIAVDTQHGDDWFAGMRKIIRSPEEAERVLRGGLRLLDARARMFDGIGRAIGI